MMENKTESMLQTGIAKIKTWWNTITAGTKTKDGQLGFSFGVKRVAYIRALCVLAGVAVVFVGLVGLAWYKHQQLNQELNQLTELNTYHLAAFKSNEFIVEERDNLPSNISEMIAFYDDAKATKEKVEAELNFKKSVYSEFLRNLLLPSLNIWKNPYTKEIDLSILGKKYLDQNPYQDIALLSQWSSIIRESGQDIGTNEVVNVQIGDVKEEANGFFHIPISISFKSDSKRAFLLLVDKLSLTSNINNIGLFNDFTYHLFDVIRANKQEEIGKLVEKYNLDVDKAVDQRTFQNMVISQYLYESMLQDDASENLLVDNQIIDMVIKQSVLCEELESQESCYFRFRDKYRTIPGLAYSVGVASNLNKVALLKSFYASIPPLIAIQSFSFDRAKSQGVSLAKEGEYMGNVSFNIYGRGISNEESQEISELLKEACFGSGARVDLTPSGALGKVVEKLNVVSSSTETSDGKVTMLSNLIELRDSLTEADSKFSQLSPYQQMIKKFEIYRELRNMSLCNG